MDEQLNGCVIALLVANGVHVKRVEELRQELVAQGARTHLIALHAQPVLADDGSTVAVDAPVGGISPRYYDGIIIPDCRSVSEILDVDDETVALLQVFVEEQRPIGAIGNGVALVADAAILEGRRIACAGEVADLVRESGGEPVEQSIVSDRLITTGRQGCDLSDFLEPFSQDVHSLRSRDIVEERSNESFPASDARSGSSAVHAGP
jgi:protease I